MKIILFFILFLNLFFKISSTTTKTLELYISSNNGIDKDGCGLKDNNKCKSINYAINSIYNNKDYSSINKLKLLLESGIYENSESLNIDFNLSIEKLSFKERAILKFIDEEDQVIVREHEEEDSGSDEVSMFNEDYEDYEDEILEEIEINQKEEDQVVLINSNINENPMFSILSNQPIQVSFKGIAFKSSNGFSYFIENINKQEHQVDISVINCKFETQQNQFINIQDGNIQLEIKNSIFLGSHNKEIPMYSGAINIKSNQIESNDGMAANVFIENSIFKNIRGCPIYLKNNNNNNEIQLNNAKFNFQLKNSIFYNNIKSIHGGAVSISGYNSTLIENSIFDNNEALQQGGSVSISKSNYVLILNCRFNRNRSNSNGGSVFFFVIYKTVNIQDSKFVDNFAQYGGSSYFGNCSNVLLSSNKFIDNKAVVYGASIYCSFSNINLADYGNQFKRNAISVTIQTVSHYTPPQYYYGFDCFVENKKGSTCQFTGANQTFINEVLGQPNCGSTSISFFILDNIEYLILSVSFLFIPIIVLFIKMSNKRSEQLKSFLITDDELIQRNKINQDEEEEEVKLKAISKQQKNIQSQNQQNIKKRK